MDPIVTVTTAPLFVSDYLTLTMSRQDKATTEKFTKTLRDLVKQQDNKVCADCKRNGKSLLCILE